MRDWNASRSCLATRPSPCWATPAGRSTRSTCICRGRISSTAWLRSTTGRTRCCGTCESMFAHGRLGGTGYLSILPVDQGIEHSAGASFAPNPAYFDPEKIVELAHEGGCNAVASTIGVLGAVSRRWAHKIPFIVKLNHNELLTYPNEFDQTMFGSARQAWEMGAAAVGATIYFGSEQSRRQLRRGQRGLRGGPPARECSPSCGATCATRRSRRTASTTASRPTSPARRTISASRSRRTSSSRRCRR